MFDKNAEIRNYSRAILFGFMGLSAFTSFWSVYFNSIGLSKSQIGLVYSVYYLVGACVLPLLNKLTAKPMLVQKMMPIFFCGAGLSAILFIFEKSFIGIILIIIFFAATRLPGVSMLESQLKIFTNHQQRDYSELRVYGTIGYMVITFFGGYLIDYAGFNAIFIVSAVVFALSFINMKRFKKIQVAPDLNGSNVGDIKVLLKNKKFILLLVGQLFTCAAFVGIEGFFPIYLTQRGFSISTIGLMTAITLVSEMLTIFAIRKIPQRVNASIGQIFIGLSLIVRCVLYALDVPTFLIFILVVVNGMQNGTYVTLTMRYIGQVAEERNIGIANLIVTMVFCTVCGLINLFGGRIIDSLSFGYFFFIVSGIALVGVLIVVIFKRILYKPAKMEKIL